jgi:hypothetical protein
MSDRDQSEQANDHAIEALKQILTLSSAILAVTITFIRDVLGDAKAEAHLLLAVPVSWSFLAFSLWFAYAAIADSAMTLGTAGSPAGYVFKSGTKTGRLAFLAQYSFLIGLSLMALFAVINFGIGLASGGQPGKIQSATPTSTPTATTIGRQIDHRTMASGPALVSLGCVGPFASGDANPPTYPTGASGGACGSIQDLIERLRDVSSGIGEPSFLVFLGSADKESLHRAVLSQFGSNEGLARVRAENVKTKVWDQLHYSESGHPESVALTVGPAESFESDLVLDRRVRIFGLWGNYKAGGAVSVP